GLIAERAVRPDVIEIEPPRFDAAPRVGQAKKPVQIEALVAKLSVEALDEAVLDRLTRSDEGQGHASLVGPLLERPAGALRAVVEDDAAGVATALSSDGVQDSPDSMTGERGVDLDRQAFARGVVDDVERTKDAAAGQRVAHEVERPLDVGSDRYHT